ncbi:MAG: Taurine-binding periplasmic protein TauA [uncultured Thiotrichaceae bacterium]|uniref:Taurine-binding periplasmic protein TauA n=1 Tax=uncultured Thiotrichaceae bacterium TaxID=298394 RepID=A0A6S6TKM2_9GAMM|nr:MAG: Taurine-binding periplasmic protein TauA [uncultured Thiotrichaceae bacterium]
MKKTLLALMVSVAATGLSMQAAHADSEITVGYFLEWPMPFLAAKADGSYDEAMGAKVKWRAFETGTAMSAAMASGDVQISVSQGLPPFVVATSAGQDLQIVDIAVSYSENDNCVVASKLEITKDNAKELEGKKVAVPMGTAAHYGFLRQMDHFGVALDSLEVVNMPPPEGASALSTGAVDFACGWGGGLKRMKEHGNILITGEEKEELGILVFDVTSATAGYIAENEEMLAKFLATTAAANAKWNSDRDPEMLAVIAKESGMDLKDAEAAIATMDFPDVETQLSEKWLGGGVQSFMKGVADVFVEAKSIDKALPSYDDTVNNAPLEAASK